MTQFWNGLASIDFKGNCLTKYMYHSHLLTNRIVALQNANPCFKRKEILLGQPANNFEWNETFSEIEAFVGAYEFPFQ